jgi:hypothetical protein
MGNIRITTSEELEEMRERGKTTIGRFCNFFEGAPHGRQEWMTETPEDIAAFFLNAAIELQKDFENERKLAIEEHSRKNWLVRMWREFRGWNPPKSYSLDEIHTEIAAKCLRLANWMEANESRPFYVGSDMSYLVWKPRVVARIISD